ncbi:MAG: SCO family protein [Spirochaetales bacterium]|nr:SCO family protein [Spirochaetales bacterium]
MKGRLFVLRIIGILAFMSVGYIIYYTIGSGKPRSFWQDKLESINLYGQKGKFVDASGTPVDLLSLSGRPALFSFVFLKCRLSCPVIIHELKKVRPLLPGELRFVLFLFDEERQSREDLEEFFRTYEINAKDWLVLQGEKDDISSLARVFRLQYSEAEEDRYNYMHTNFFALADSSGQIKLQIRGFEKDSEDFYRKIAEALQ